MKAATKVMTGAGVAAVITLFALARHDLAESTTASAVRPVRAFDREDWTIADLKGFNDSLTESDLTSICAALNREPEYVSRPVLSIERLSPTEIQIYTGVLRGPLNGGGHELRLRHENGQWMVVECHFWIS